MKQLISVVLGGVMVCGYGLAQETATPQPGGAPTQSQQSPTTSPAATTGAEQATATPRIAPGSVIPVQLTKTVDAKKAKTGDPVEARVTQDLKNANGQTLLAKDTKVVGHVIEDQPSSKEQKESHIAIAFDRVVAKSGGEAPLPMSIQAIINPSALGGGNNGNANNENAPSAPSSGGMAPGGSSGRSTGMGAGTPPPASSPSNGSEARGNTQADANSHQPITGNTQGVVGMSDLKLSATSNAAQGSVVSSDKNNVKLESGTFMLLRVSQ